MCADAAVREALCGSRGAPACTVLDAGRIPVDRNELAAAIRSILDQEIAELARDRNSICYRVPLGGRGGVPVMAVVKVPRPGPQRTNDDTTFAWEAAILLGLPAAGIVDVPLLLARIAAAGRHFLVTTELPGKHPDARAHPLDGRQLRAILDGLYAMDCQFFMHYDLKAANILVDGARVGFIDFEFSRFESCGNAYAPDAAVFLEDFNVSGNPFFPTRSNVANFEFRALDRYLRKLSLALPAAAEALHSDWLRGKSAYHRRMADFLAGLPEAPVELVAGAGGLSMDLVRGRLRAAAAYESLLATLFRDPCAAVARVERLLMAYRCAIFENQVDAAGRLRREALAALRGDAASAEGLPDPYLQASRRVLERVGRSIHPSVDPSAQAMEPARQRSSRPFP